MGSKKIWIHKLLGPNSFGMKKYGPKIKGKRILADLNFFWPKKYWAQQILN